MKQDGCVVWGGGLTSSGYGYLYVRNLGQVLAHRRAFENACGQIPDGMQVCHRCDNPPCVNPSHLFLGSIADNMRDKVAKGRQLRGEMVPTHKLTERDVLSLRCDERPQREIAKAYGVSQSAISLLRNGRRWAHVQEENASFA